jgi:hypothetical protein
LDIGRSPNFSWAEECQVALGLGHAEPEGTVHESDQAALKIPPKFLLCHYGTLKERRPLKEKEKTKAPAPSDDEDAKASRIRYALDTMPGVIKEICKVYREMRAEQLDHVQGRSLVWVLSMLRAALETQSLERLEQRLEELAPSIEGKAHGLTRPNHPYRPTH